MTRTTRTDAVLEVPRTVYAAVRALLARAGYAHAFDRRTDGEVIHMHGLALRAPVDAPEAGEIVVGSVLSGRTKEGRVELSVDGTLVQLDLDKAREVVGMLQQAIEAASTDQMLYAFLTTRLGVPTDSAAAALLDFRELRQGSREVVRPS